MKLHRRTFLTLLSSIGGLTAIRVFAWPFRWPKQEAGEQESKAAKSGPAADTANSTGLKFTTVRRRTLGDSPYGWNTDPTVFYVRGDWRRWEAARSSSGYAKPDGSIEQRYGPHVATIVRPDLGKTFELNLDTSEYAVMPYATRRPQPLTKKQIEARGISVPLPGTAKTTFRIETTTKDTGERKEMFGYVARHVITTRKEIPLEGSSRTDQETLTDAWYIDLEPRFYPTIFAGNLPLDGSGKPRAVHSYVTGTTARPGERPKLPTETPEFVDIGQPEGGFAVQETRVSRNSYKLPDGSTKESREESETIVRIEKGNYDAALFEVPSSFRRVAHIERNPK